MRRDDVAKETSMSGSTLDTTGEEPPVTNLGHGTRALGPSDSSDTGSDVVGGPGMDEGLSDEQARRAPLKSRGTAGRDIGDVDLDADSDRAGTGERGSSGIDTPADADLGTRIEPGIESAADEFDDPDALPEDDPNDGSRDLDGSVSDGAT
jgi:hypothetical protein